MRSHAGPASPVAKPQARAVADKLLGEVVRERKQINPSQLMGRSLDALRKSLFDTVRAASLGDGSAEAQLVGASMQEIEGLWVEASSELSASGNKRRSIEGRMAELAARCQTLVDAGTPAERTQVAVGLLRDLEASLPQSRKIGGGLGDRPTVRTLGANHPAVLGAGKNTP
ncbi:MAG: hypothetical protein GY937_08635 [bacterium]|nr:hypothetical protein [bacterium]